MKYCIDYNKNFRYNDIIDEIICYGTNILEEIKEQKWKDNQRIIVDIIAEGEKGIPAIRMFMKEHPNTVVRIDTYQKDIENELKNLDVPFFYDSYCNTADEVYGLIQKGITDVYITESLAFNLAEIGAYCKSKNVKVRIIPNIAQYKNGFGDYVPDPCKFFVRPEDTYLYEPFVDVFQFIAPKDRISIIYEIYRNRQWAGDLSQLIVGFKEPFYNTGIVPLFGERRLECRQKCMQEKCDLCKQIKELSNKIHSNNLVIKTPIDKEWKNESKTHKEIVRFVEESATSTNDEIPEE